LGDTIHTLKPYTLKAHTLKPEIRKPLNPRETLNPSNKSQSPETINSKTLNPNPLNPHHDTCAVLYVDSAASWTRTGTKMLGVDIADIPNQDTMRMQIAADMEDLVI
jgi:hypothetical protein